MEKNGEYIKTIAEVRSISLAAEKLGISQPALSSFLKKKESEIGAVLFDRSKQPLELTEAGSVYLDYLDRMSILKNEMSQNIADIEGMKTGHLAIGGASFFNIVYLPKAVGRFMEKYPGINIEIIDGKVPELVTAAQKGTLDLFITPFADEEERFFYEELLEETIYICVPSDWAVNRELSGKTQSGEPLTAKEFKRLCEHTFVTLKPDQHIGQKLEALFEKYNCRPVHTVLAEQTMTTLALTMSGVGVSLIAESSIRNSNIAEKPALYLADPEICTRKIYISYPRNKYLSKAAEEFIEILKTANRQVD
ncbi:MAG: LysR family transcriptional regulator [Lentihominibacter sp.]|jgi:LysR family hydrogen peroxide-inducible transcriptional activator